MSNELSASELNFGPAHIRDTEHVLEQLDLLAKGSLPLIKACQLGLAGAIAWILVINKNRTPASRVGMVTAQLQSALEDFHEARLAIIKPYRHLFDPAHPLEDGHGKVRTSEPADSRFNIAVSFGLSLRSTIW
jgi:hypothetical protein